MISECGVAVPYLRGSTSALQKKCFWVALAVLQASAKVTRDSLFKIQWGIAGGNSHSRLREREGDERTEQEGI